MIAIAEGLFDVRGTSELDDCSNVLRAGKLAPR